MKFPFISADVLHKDRPFCAAQFRYHVQMAVLLALKEEGIIDYADFCSAEQALKHQYQKYITAI